MLLDAMEKHHVRSITWVSFFLPLIRTLVHTAYELSITRSSSCPRTALLVLRFHATVRAESRNCSHELRALGSDHGNHRSRGWLAPLIHAATDFFPPPFYRSPRHRLDLVTWAWRNASYLLFCVSTSPRDLDAADRSRREQW